MTTDQKDSLKLRHIVDAIEHILDFTKSVSEEEFVADYEKQSAVIRQFEIIGEAASKFTSGFVERYNNVDWPKVVGMRHKMIHDYFDVDVKIVWATVTDDVPALKESLNKILENW